MAPVNDGNNDGFWGQPTSTIDWCEYNYEVSPYIAEFWNTITNLSMIIPPIYGICDVLKNQHEKRFIICHLALLLVGIGSWLFHMTLNYEMQLLDEIPMVFASAILAYNIYQVQQPMEKKNFHIFLFLLVYCLFFLFTYLYINKPIFQEVMYGILVVVLLIMDIKLAFNLWSKYNFWLLICGTVMYSTGFLLWNIDNNYCQSLRDYRTNHPTFAPVTQFHGWWHIFAGYATYLQIIGITFQRQKYLNRSCHYKLAWIGIGLENQSTKLD